MREIFVGFYSWLAPMYGYELDQHLSGYDAEGGWSGNCLYVPLGLVLWLGSLLMVMLFYYGINSVRFSRGWHWMLILGVNFLFQLLFGFYLPFLDYDRGDIAPDLAELIREEHLWYFGLANGLLSVVIFTLGSFLLRRRSGNCSLTPIPKW